ncbi:MAG: DUF362 domain-containing protein [Candidatus Thorarchaeota archaeon]|nr:DUF362 domain-containing protein [Candidatus Thorarchaeota archaeon]
MFFCNIAEEFLARLREKERRLMDVSMNSIALVKYRGNIKRALEQGLVHIGGFGELASPVLIKPNICTINDGTGYSVTRVETVEALIELLLETDKRLSIRIVESDSESKFAKEAFQKFGYTQLCADMEDSGFDVGTVNLSNTPLMKLSFQGDYFENPELPEVIINAGYFISVAIPKTHYLAFLTGVLKNLFGTLPRKNQAFYHSRIDEVIVDLARIIRPNLSIVDARVGVEGWNGPKTRQLGAFIMGHGAVSVDSTMARIMGFEPEQVPHIMSAYDYDMGTINPIVSGESIDSFRIKFASPR